jgi:hypothetical protein
LRKPGDLESSAEAFDIVMVDIINVNVKSYSPGGT